jgi:hypothetical protein
VVDFPAGVIPDPLKQGVFQEWWKDEVWGSPLIAFIIMSYSLEGGRWTLSYLTAGRRWGGFPAGRGQIGRPDRQEKGLLTVKPFIINALDDFPSSRELVGIPHRGRPFLGPIGELYSPRDPPKRTLQPEAPDRVPPRRQQSVNSFS